MKTNSINITVFYYSDFFGHHSLQIKIRSCIWSLVHQRFSGKSDSFLTKTVLNLFLIWRPRATYQYDSSIPPLAFLPFFSLRLWRMQYGRRNKKLDVQRLCVKPCFSHWHDMTVLWRPHYFSNSFLKDSIMPQMLSEPKPGCSWVTSVPFCLLIL